MEWQAKFRVQNEDRAQVNPKNQRGRVMLEKYDIILLWFVLDQSQIYSHCCLDRI